MQTFALLALLFLGSVASAPETCEKFSVDTEEAKGQCCLYLKRDLQQEDVRLVVERRSRPAQESPIYFPDGDLVPKNPHEDGGRRFLDMDGMDQSRGSEEETVGGVHRRFRGRPRIEHASARPTNGTRKNGTVEIGSRNFIDAKDTCPEGSRIGNNGKCQEIFV
ncbi:unnamed protein product [Phyllotreta striolata]|uniref:Uncharacterized protein n=1 Tax=Phyllotreta striolata TaxID=444603 RepID=A0A9N9XHY2_PHYSR|nr:unnamed protein product [Phyllotreta striolata]